jgi:hypothetical protein
MKLVTFDKERVGHLDGDEIVVLDVPTMRAWFERGGADETGERVALAEAKLRAPIGPKKFFHTAGNFREHEEESKVVDWSHEIAPWIVFFQNVDAIIGPDEPVVYPEHLTEELDYELELAVILKKSGKWFPPEDAMDYVGGYVIFNDIRRATSSWRGYPAFSASARRSLPLPARPMDRDPGRDSRPAQSRDGAAGERRDAADVPFRPDERHHPGDHQPLLGTRILGRRRSLDRDSLGRGGLFRGRGLALPEAGRRDRGGSRHRRAPKSGDRLAGGAGEPLRGGSGGGVP